MNEKSFGSNNDCIRVIQFIYFFYFYLFLFLSLLVSSYPAGSETIKTQSASGHPEEDETFPTVKNDWACSVFARGFGLTLFKAAPIRLPAVVGVRRCNNGGKKKKRRISVNSSYWRITGNVTKWIVPKSSSERFAIKHWVTKFHISKFPSVVLTTDLFLVSVC